MTDPTRPVPSAASDDTRLSRVGDGRWQLALVLVTLIALSILPVITKLRVDGLREQINSHTDPALAQLATVTTEVALEAAARRGYLLSRDPGLAASVTSSRVRRGIAVAELETRTENLDSAVNALRTRFLSRLHAVDAQLDSLVAQGASAERYSAAIDVRERRFAEALEAGESLRVAIENAGNVRRARIESAERLNALLTGVLVLLGFGAALAAGRLASALRAAASAVQAHGRERERLLESEHRARQAAETQRKQLEHVTESRARLIRGFTHDVKNPLGAADGHLALLEEGIRGPLAPAQQESVGRARRSIRVALDLIGQLLDLARAESGQIAARREPVDVCVVVREVVDAFTATAEGKRLSLAAELPEELPTIVSDAGRLRQILANLVSNAVKYTPEGGRVDVRAIVTDGEKAPAAGTWFAVEVVDNGRGIEPDQLPFLFQEFTRFDPQAAEGSGIGLAISERLARALGGSITVESEVARGSRFTLWIPGATLSK